MHYIMTEETTRRFKMLSTRECPCDQYDELCFQFMQGVRFLGGNNFRKDKINNKPDKILRMCSSLVSPAHQISVDHFAPFTGFQSSPIDYECNIYEIKCY